MTALKRILVASDDASIRIIEETLKADYEVRAAKMPSAAIDLVRGEPFDLVISDINMHEMNGFWMCKQIRKVPGREAIPFLFLSVDTERAEFDIAKSLGSQLLVRPFQLDGLVRAVRGVLGEPGRETCEVAGSSSVRGVARILVLDDDDGILDLVAATLSGQGFAISSAETPSAALGLARTEEFDLVISDVNLPEMNGFEFRDAFRALHGDSARFLFMSSADEVAEQDIAESLRGDRLVLKPFSPADMRRAAHGALRFTRVVSGPLPGKLDHVIHDVAENKWTGVLTVVNRNLMKKVVVHDGAVVLAASNDTRDLIGQAFLRAGLISERDLLSAFEHRAKMLADSPSPQIGTVLAALRKVTPEQCSTVFREKIRQSVLDLYFWSEGAVEFAEGEIPDLKEPLPIHLDLQSIRKDGGLRRTHWLRVAALFPDRNVSFRRTGAEWPEGFPRGSGELAMVRHIEAGRTMAAILLEMHGQDYAVGMRLAGLVQAGVLETVAGLGSIPPVPFEDADIELSDAPCAAFGNLVDGDPSGAASLPQPEAPPARHAAKEASAPPWAATLSKALTLIRQGKLQEAQAGLLEVLSLDPLNNLARFRLSQVEAGLAKKAREQGLDPSRVLRLTIPLGALVGMMLSPNEAFVLSRLSGGELTVVDLVCLCPFPEHEVLGVLLSHLRGGVIA